MYFLMVLDTGGVFYLVMLSTPAFTNFINLVCNWNSTSFFPLLTCVNDNETNAFMDVVIVAVIKIFMLKC